MSGVFLPRCIAAMDAHCSFPSGNFTWKTGVDELRDTVPDELCFKEALLLSQAGAATPDSDRLVGRLCEDELVQCRGKWVRPFCSRPEYSHTSWCGCVNSNLAHPECGQRDCASNPYAYMTYEMRNNQRSGACDNIKQFVCNNFLATEGQAPQSLSDVHQVVNCGDNIAPAAAPPPATLLDGWAARLGVGKPALLALLGLLALILVGLVVAAAVRAAGGPRPEPPGPPAR